MTEHFPGHQQALIKNNLVVAILSFNEHDENIFKKTFKKFDYDISVSLCEYPQPCGIDFVWNGNTFLSQPFPSWILSDNLEWLPPKEKPVGNFVWDEEKSLWLEIDPECGCPKEYS